MNTTRRQLADDQMLLQAGSAIQVNPGAEINLNGTLTLKNDGRGGIGDLRTEAGAVIEIVSGAVLEVAAGADLTVEGSMTLNGTLERNAPIGQAGDLTCLLPQHYSLAPAAVSATAIHAAVTLTDEAQDVTTAITQPDFPRTLTAKGNASGIEGDVVITGTNILGVEITDTIALNGATEVEGAKAFASVTNIALPAETHEGTDTVSIGRGKKFGMPHVVYNAGFLLVKLFHASADTGTLAVDADEIEKNLFALNGTPDGAKIIDLVYLA
jgi:hypothetical protein